MEAVGLRLLTSADVLPAYSAAGVLPQSIASRISLSKFSRVNGAKGRWALIEDLAAVQEGSRPAQGLAAATGADGAWQRAAASFADPSAAASTRHSAEELERVVRAAAAEILGELDSSGQFPPGASRALLIVAWIEAASTHGFVACCR